MLYRQRDGSPMETCMCWGFPGDGWFEILWGLSERIEDINRKAGKPLVTATQVKEKYGTLRFYYMVDPESTENTSEVWDKVDKWVDDAEAMSEKTCEVCGQPGELRNNSWILTLCDACDTKRK